MTNPQTSAGLSAPAILSRSTAILVADVRTVALPLVLLALATTAIAEGPMRTASLGAAVVFGVASGLLILVLQLSGVFAARRALQGERPALGATLREGAGAFPRAILPLLAMGVLVAVGLLLFVIPGLVVFAGLFPVLAIVSAERGGLGDTLTRTWSLTHGHRLTLFLVGLIVVVGAGIAMFVLGAVPVVGPYLAAMAWGLTLAVEAAAIAVFYERRVALDETPPERAAGADAAVA